MFDAKFLNIEGNTVICDNFAGKMRHESCYNVSLVEQFDMTDIRNIAENRGTLRL